MTSPYVTNVKAPGCKAIIFGILVIGLVAVGLHQARPAAATKVAVAETAVPALSVVRAAEIPALVSKRAAKGRIEAGKLGTAVALVALAKGKPIAAVDIVPVPCLTTASSFSRIVVALAAPVPASIKKGAHLRMQRSAGMPAVEAVFVGTVERPKDTSSDAAAVAYAEVVVASADAPGFAGTDIWSFAEGACS